MGSASRIALCLSAAVGMLAATESAWAQQTTMERIKRSGAISVCVDPDRLPYSSDKPSPTGFDVDVAQEIAKELGYKLNFTWYSTHRGTKIVRQLDETNCDFFTGFPVEASFEENNFKVILSKAYYSSGFATLARADAPDTILQDSKKKGVGVLMGTLPDFRLFDRGYERKLFRTTKEIFDAVKHKDIDAAVVPALEGGWELKSTGDSSLKVLANTEKDFVFPMAVAVRKADKDFRGLIDGAVEKLATTGKMKEIFAKYGMVDLQGTGGGEAPKSRADIKKEEAAKGGDGGKDGSKADAPKPAEAAPSPDKKADAGAAPAAEKKVEVAAAETTKTDAVKTDASKSDAAKPEAPKADAPAAAAPAAPAAAEAPKAEGDGGADMHGIAMKREDMVDPRQVDDFPCDPKTVDEGRKLYKQACYKCHGPNGVSGGTIPDLRKFAAKADHYDMFMVVQAGRLDKGMPAWNDYLTGDEIKKIVVYVKSLHKK